ncbi:MAG: hypothetical protein ABJD24_05530 [Acidimicrobiales bacterium]
MPNTLSAGPGYSAAIAAATSTAAGPATAARPSRSRSRLWISLLAPLAASIFTLVELRAETMPVQPVNDTAFHVDLVRFAAQRITDHRTPFDGWDPHLSMGFASTHHYQSLPHIVMGAVAGDRADPRTVVLWSLYLLLAVWPFAVYGGLRLFGFSCGTAAAGSLLAPLIASNTLYGFEWGSYLWRGNGLWAQLWAMVLMPIALPLALRWLRAGRGLLVAALPLGAVLALHYTTAYLALIVIAIWTLIVVADVVRRAVRALLLFAVSGCLFAFSIIPAFLDRNWANYAPAGNTTAFFRSLGARTILSNLLHGRVYDAGRLPVITVLVAAGLGLSVVRWRHDMRLRALATGWLTSVLLYFGPATFGAIYNGIPGHGVLLFHRFIAGVHLFGLLLAAVAAAELLNALHRAALRAWPRAPAWRPSGALAFVAAIALIPAVQERDGYSSTGRDWINIQRKADASYGNDVGALLQIATAEGGGRVYAGSSANWGANYKIGFAPAYITALNDGADAVGFLYRTVSATAAVEPFFNEHNLASYDLLGVRYLLLRDDFTIPVDPRAVQLVAARGRHRLFRVVGSGYVGVFDTDGPTTTTMKKLGSAMASLVSNPPAHRLPVLAVDGGPRPAATLKAGAAVPASVPGTVQSTQAQPELGVFTTSVHLERPAAVVLKSTFIPGWQAFIDGRRAPTQYVGPAFVGVNVSAGDHIITFRYEPRAATWTWLLLGWGSAALIVLGTKVRPMWAFLSTDRA